MPFKMIANRSVYLSKEGKEYARGASFTVETEGEMTRLIRTKRARADDTKTAPVKPTKREAAPVVQKVVTPEDPAKAAADDPAPVIENSQTEFPKPNRYRRSDMRAED